MGESGKQSCAKIRYTVAQLLHTQGKLDSLSFERIHGTRAPSSVLIATTFPLLPLLPFTRASFSRIFPSMENSFCRVLIVGICLRSRNGINIGDVAVIIPRFGCRKCAAKRRMHSCVKRMMMDEDVYNSYEFKQQPLETSWLSRCISRDLTFSSEFFSR